MKVRTDLRAGNGAKWEKAMKQCIEDKYAMDEKIDYLEQLVYGHQGTSPTPPAPPTPGTQGCGFINGMYYPDRSGVCG